MKTTLLAVVLLVPLAASAAPVALTPAAGSAVWIEGDSTLHPWSSTSTKVALEMTLEEGTLAAAKAQKPAKLVVKVPVDSLKSEHGGLDKNLQKALNAKEHPEIVFAMDSYKTEGSQVSATGSLTINGTTKPATVAGELSEQDGKLVVQGKHPLVMSEFGVKPPKMMMGAVKVADKVLVEFKLVLAKP